MEQHIILMGINYRTASVDLREKFALSKHCDLDSWAIPAPSVFEDAIFDESFILSTCNRVEVIVVGHGAGLPNRILEMWASACGNSVDDIMPCIYRFDDAEAIRHLFSVASSLDSMVLGEPQILGQVKDAYRKAVAAGMCGSIINRLMHKAFSVAKRVRSETEVASSAVSISYAAVELAKRIFGRMSDYTAMLIGAGEMAELAAENLMRAGLSHIIVCNRTFANAAMLAKRFKGIPIPFEEMTQRLPDADIVISSTGSTYPILHADDVRGVLKRRKNRPMFFIDIAVPRDIDPDVNNIDNIYLYDIDDLREVVDENVLRRKSESIKAIAIVNEETVSACEWLHSLDLQPTIVDLLTRLDKMADMEIATTTRHHPGITPELRDAMKLMLRSYSRKIVNNSLEYIKNAHAKGEISKLRLIRELFALDEPIRHRHHRHKDKGDYLGGGNE